MNKIKYIALLTIVFNFLLVTKANAQTWNIGFPDTTKVKAILTGNKLVIEGMGAMKNYPRHKIWKDSVTSVYIKKGVTNIGHHAFYDCRKLKTITIPDGVTVIGESAFKNCKNLATVIIPNSVTVIKRNAFERCTSLKAVSIPDNTLEIEEYAFYECFSLENVLLGKGLNQIGDCAFRACHNLSSITIPKSTNTIGKIAFRECYNLQNFEVEKGNIKYSSVDGVLFNKKQDTLVAYPNGKEGKYKIPKSTLVIGNSAFASSKINTVHIPKTIKTIEGDAFRYCHNLSKLKVPNSVKEIGVLSFANCDSLERIKLGSGITDIGMYILSQNKSLLKIKIANKNLKFGSKKGILYNKSRDTLVMYPRGKKGSFMIPENVVCIKKGAFENCQGLTEIVIPENVTTIEDIAFQYDRNLKSITNRSTTPQKISSEVFSYVSLKNISLLVPSDVVDKYRNTGVWKEFGQIKAIE